MKRGYKKGIPLFAAAIVCLCGFLFFLRGNRSGPEGGEAEKNYIAAVDAYTEQRYEDAMNFTRKALETDKNFYQAALLEAKILFFDGRPLEAEKVFSKLVSKYPAYTEARIWHIRCLILQDNRQDAVPLLEKELSFNPGDWRVYYLYALAAQRSNNYEQRLAMNRQAELVLTDSAKVYMDLALTWYTLGIPDRADDYLVKARTISGMNLSMAQLENALDRFMKE
jgi:tetratricopeptide (TPR) repeat protein